MTAEQKMQILKADLQLLTSAHDVYLGKLLEMSEAAIRREGIELRPGDIECDMAVVHYAAYLFRRRAAQSSGANDYTVMPRYLRYELNNLLFSQKTRQNDDV